jgi:hypothetical protein
MKEELAQCLALSEDLAHRYGRALDDPSLLLAAIKGLLLVYAALTDEPEDTAHPHLSVDNGISWVAMPDGVELRYNAIDIDRTGGDDEPLDLRVTASSAGLYMELLAPETDSTLATALLNRAQLCALPVPFGSVQPPADSPMGALCALYDSGWISPDPCEEEVLGAIKQRARAVVEAWRAPTKRGHA